MINEYNDHRLFRAYEYNREQIQEAFKLAHFLHPRADLSRKILVEAFDKSRLLIKTINKRPQSENPHKLPIRLEDILHVAVLETSIGYEIYQEMENSSPQRKFSRCVSDYIPTYDDFIIRYVKTILKNSYDRTVRYFAIGTGTLIYRYKTVEILGISDYFDNNNSSKIKKFYENRLTDRFPALNLKQNLETNERITNLINCCFEVFTLPSVRSLDLGQIKNVRNEYFSYENSKSEREKFDVLMKCGVPRLIDEYNKYIAYGSYELAQPTERLLMPGIPDSCFNEFDKNLENRFAPSLLNDNELQLVHELVNKNNKLEILGLSEKQNKFMEDDSILEYPNDQ